MGKPDFLSSYHKNTQALLDAYDEPTAMSLAVGGEFEAVGLLEYYLLRQLGLRPEHTVVDVGCGSGRLGLRLREFLTGRYAGLDIVPEMVHYARKICARPDWRFYVASGQNIPEPEDSADFICFFSVFTHLLHEETFRYLEEARRVLRPGGKLVFSFLEFALPSHWFIFHNSLLDTRPDKVLNQFFSREAIRAWADHLDLKVHEIYDGDKPHIDLPEPVLWDNGQEMLGRGNLGQSVCVLTKS